MRLRSLEIAVLFVLLAPIIIRSQLTEPVLVDEFDKLNSESIEARLDNTSIQLRNNPGSLLEFVFRRGNAESPGQPYRRFGIFKTYLLTRKIAKKDNIIATFCGPGSTPATQVWLIGALAQRHSCTREELPSSNATLFVTSYVRNPKYEEFGCCIVDNLDLPATLEAVEAFADYLKAMPDATAYVIVYGGTNVYWTSDTRGRDRTVRHLDRPSWVAYVGATVRQRLFASGIERSRIISLAGGYRDGYAEVELWIVPPDVKRPKPSPNYFKKR